MYFAMEGQIFDEGKSLRPNTVKEGFPSPGTRAGAAVLLPGGRSRYSTNGGRAGGCAKGAGLIVFPPCLTG